MSPLDIQNATRVPLPEAGDIRRWVAAALAAAGGAGGICLRFMDEGEMRSLNKKYRGREDATNVLSFPAAENPGGALGDIAVCAPVVRRQAEEMRRGFEAHLSHILVHGTLHLLGYDHIREKDARVMEGLEEKIVLALGFPAPYEKT